MKIESADFIFPADLAPNSKIIRGRKRKLTAVRLIADRTSEEFLNDALHTIGDDYQANQEKAEAFARNNPSVDGVFFIFVNELYTAGSNRVLLFRQGTPLAYKQGEILHIGDALLLGSKDFFQAVSDLEIQADLCKSPNPEVWLQTLFTRIALRFSTVAIPNIAATALMLS